MIRLDFNKKPWPKLILIMAIVTLGAIGYWVQRLMQLLSDFFYWLETLMK